MALLISQFLLFWSESHLIISQLFIKNDQYPKREWRHWNKKGILRQAEQADLQNSHLEYFLVDYSVPPKGVGEMHLSLWLMGRDQTSSAIVSLKILMNSYFRLSICPPLLCTEAKVSSRHFSDDSLVSIISLDILSCFWQVCLLWM